MDFIQAILKTFKNNKFTYVNHILYKYILSYYKKMVYVNRKL